MGELLGLKVVGEGVMAREIAGTDGERWGQGWERGPWRGRWQ